MQRFVQSLNLESIAKVDNVFPAMAGAAIAPFIDSIYGGDRVDVILVLLAVIALDWITGVAAAFKERSYTSEYGIAGILRTLFILAFPALANMLDKAMGTPGFLFYAVTFALIYHTFNSLTANAARAGWEKWIPKSVLELVSNEMKAKSERAARKRGE